ncbi:hypothetical protein HBF26_17075 [Luteibacter jiangsuensis]|uniref:Uncharacterized protein n=1 Tax=Luteibacter jiangsuensis TaxID=637577 RepID=A0ABX0Q7T2_9GAMM|nr:hypothetical protein [Luteibacter jiangsuensis]NID06610.1 hypothetical protein [Luteibacter jiangsuensis]
MDLPIRPKPQKPRISHSVEGWFDEHGRWHPFLQVTIYGYLVALVQTLPEAFKYAAAVQVPA